MKTLVLLGAILFGTGTMFAQNQEVSHPAVVVSVDENLNSPGSNGSAPIHVVEVLDLVNNEVVSGLYTGQILAGDLVLLIGIKESDRSIINIIR